MEACITHVIDPICKDLSLIHYWFNILKIDLINKTFLGTTPFLT
nr:MAG TPA: hypothetical protein [Myoviridae sp. ctfuG5]